MPTLCRNRPEGFGPHSNLHPNLPTTCFLDVIVEPLATWIFLLFFFIVLLFTLLLFFLIFVLPSKKRPTRSCTGPPRKSSFKPDGPASPLPNSPSLLSRILSTIYYLLIVAMLAMQSLEIARLSVAELGIGLLPFTYVGILLALGNRLIWRAKVARVANACYWVMLVVVMSLKTAAEQEEQMGGERRVKGQGTQGLYPTSDEVVDNAVMVGVEVVLAVLEFNGWGRLEGGVREWGKH